MIGWSMRFCLQGQGALSSHLGLKRVIGRLVVQRIQTTTFVMHASNASKPKNMSQQTEMQAGEAPFLLVPNSIHMTLAACKKLH